MEHRDDTSGTNVNRVRDWFEALGVHGKITAYRVENATRVNDNY